MSYCAGTADLRGLPDRHQSTAHSSTARLRHVPQHLRRATQGFGKLGHIAAGQFQIKVSDGWGVDAIVPQKAHAAHADKGRVAVDPRRKEFVGQRRQDDRQRTDWSLTGPHANSRSFGLIGCHWSIASSVNLSAPLLIASIESCWRRRNTFEVMPLVTCSRRRIARAERTVGFRNGRLRTIVSTRSSNSSSADHRVSGNSSKRRASYTSPLIASRASLTPKHTKEICNSLLM